MYIHFKSNLEGLTIEKINDVVEKLNLSIPLKIMRDIKWFYGDNFNKIVEMIDIRKCIIENFNCSLESALKYKRTSSSFSGGFECQIVIADGMVDSLVVTFIPVMLTIHHSDIDEFQLVDDGTDN